MRKLGRGLLILAIAAALIVAMAELRRDASQAPSPARPAGASPSPPSSPSATGRALTEPGAPAPLSPPTFRSPPTAEPARQRVAAAGGTLEPPCVIGVVRDAEGRAVPDALVALFRPREILPGLAELGASLGSGRTDAQGVFALAAPAAGAGHLVRARGAGHGPAEMRGIAIAIDRPTVVGPLVLQRACTLAGTVRGTQGAPIAGAEVSVEPGGAEFLFGAEPDQAVRTDASGVWRAERLAPGAKDIRVRAAGYAFAGRGGVVARVETPVEGVDFTLAPERAIRGRVTAPDGRAIAQARIDAHAVAAEAQGTEFESWGEATSNADGVFAVRGLAAGTYALEVTAQGFAPSAIAELAAGSTDVEIVLQPLAFLSGRVSAAEDGRPLASFVIELAHGGTLTVTEFRDPAGRFELPVPPDTPLLLRASAPERVPGEHGPVVVASHTAPAELELRLDGGPALRGNLVAESGAPWGSLRLRLVPEASDSMPLLGLPSVNEPLGVAETTSDDAGAFVFEHVAPGAYRLQPVDPDVALVWSPRFVVGATAQSLRPLTAALAGTLEGTLVDAAGAPAPGRLVEIAGPHASRFALSDEHGRFRIEGLAPGEHTVTLADADGARERVQIEPSRVAALVLTTGP